MCFDDVSHVIPTRLMTLDAIIELSYNRAYLCEFCSDPSGPLPHPFFRLFITYKKL